MLASKFVIDVSSSFLWLNTFSCGTFARLALADKVPKSWHPILESEAMGRLFWVDSWTPARLEVTVNPKP